MVQTENFSSVRKKALINDTAVRTGHTRATVREVFDAAADIARTAIGRGDPVFLIGLGKLSVVRRAARPARNPRTGEAVMVPERNTLVFRPSDKLVEAVADGSRS